MRGMPDPASNPSRMPASDASGDADRLFRQAVALVAAQRHEEAFPLHLRAAQAGHGHAQVELARMLLHGVGTATDLPAALHWLHTAEHGGSTVAGYHLALLGCGDHAVPFDNQMDARLLAAVNAGYPPALLAAAVHFGRKPHAEDQQLCLALLDRAAHAGSVVAAQLLAERLAAGEGSDVDMAAAEALWEQLDAHGVARLPRLTVPLPTGTPSAPRALALQELFAPPALKPLSEAPRVAIIEHLLSADECRLLIASSTQRLKRSRAVDPRTGLPMEVELRTSSDATFDPVVQDLALRLVQARMAAAAGSRLVDAEQLTVLRYLPGEEYRPHRDYVPPGSLERDRPQAGNRVRTICAYLNTVPEGGETEFPHASLKVAPVAGRVMVFDNLHADGRPDPHSLHAGLPVVRGEKWLATLWLRQRRYRDF